MSRTLACFVSPTSPEEYKPQALQQLQAWSTCETNQTCESPCTGRTHPPHVKRRQLWPTLLWNRFLIDRKSKQIGVLSTLAGLHGSRVETCICWHCHTFPTGFCTSGAAYCIIKRGRRVTYIKQTEATQQSAEWAESVYACRKGREGKGEGLQTLRCSRVKSWCCIFVCELQPRWRTATDSTRNHFSRS